MEEDFTKLFNKSNLKKSNIKIFLKQYGLESLNHDLKTTNEYLIGNTKDEKHRYDLASDISSFLNVVGPSYLFFGITKNGHFLGVKLNNSISYMEEKISNKIGSLIQTLIEPTFSGLEVKVTKNTTDSVIIAIIIPDGPNKPYACRKNTTSPWAFLGRNAQDKYIMSLMEIQSWFQNKLLTLIQSQIDVQIQPKVENNVDVQKPIVLEILHKRLNYKDTANIPPMVRNTISENIKDQFYYFEMTVVNRSNKASSILRQGIFFFNRDELKHEIPLDIKPRLEPGGIYQFRFNETSLNLGATLYDRSLKGKSIWFVAFVETPDGVFKSENIEFTFRK